MSAFVARVRKSERKKVTVPSDEGLIVASVNVEVVKLSVVVLLKVGTGVA